MHFRTRSQYIIFITQLQFPLKIVVKELNFFYILLPKSFAHKGLDSENKRIQTHP